MALLALLCCVSLVVVMEEKSFNKAFDYIVPLYALFSIALITYTFKTHNAENVLEGDIDDRKFAYKKPSKMENLTWKQKLIGVFEKYERNHFKEVRTTEIHNNFLCCSLFHAYYVYLMRLCWFCSSWFSMALPPLLLVLWQLRP
ncbi:hypothetical protein EON65_23900 [archaeon]|nr:MAG: hypothetical protein EON65_23900 [archaeon]